MPKTHIEKFLQFGNLRRKVLELSPLTTNERDMVDYLFYLVRK